MIPTSDIRGVRNTKQLVMRTQNIGTYFLLHLRMNGHTNPNPNSISNCYQSIRTDANQTLKRRYTQIELQPNPNSNFLLHWPFHCKGNGRRPMNLPGFACSLVPASNQEAPSLSAPAEGNLVAEGVEDPAAEGKA
ncbi:hypothetical protein C2845_PM17G08900 [Panicum miliaceum]|uniref:Uncharacterized protein n=1 Tax=Panicum miliaceum TaxID=4540 RepID=A0A3L6Q6F0_PANMI|nr:hypothetical protein C2845_PM17G08900 [Panicum miliaceum]